MKHPVLAIFRDVFIGIRHWSMPRVIVPISPVQGSQAPSSEKDPPKGEQSSQAVGIVSENST